MNQIKRATFLKYGLQLGTLALLPTARGMNAMLSTGKQDNNEWLQVDPVFRRMVAANDRKVPGLITKVETGSFSAGRQTGFDVALLAASFCCKHSTFYHSTQLVGALKKLVDRLLAVQNSDGTLNFNNIGSPPDTAFLLEPMIAATRLLLEEDQFTTQSICSQLHNFIVKAGDALVTGGVHTPNHRWLVCGVLARLYDLYPDEQYINRIDQWLREGIFIDADGHYPERSVNYAVVENNGLTAIGRLLNRPAMFEPVRKNLEMTWYYMEPGGDLVSNDSRRQDQYGTKNIIPYYLLYRWYAIRDNNARFAAIAQQIEQFEGFEEQVANRYLFHFLENSILQRGLPKSSSTDSNYEKLFTTSHLLRIRRQDVSATLFGGVDWPLVIASGRSNSPNFFSFRKGNAVLKYMRLSVDFFDTGYFYSEGLIKTETGYMLHQKIEVPYYQPLPGNKIQQDGDYQLSQSIDGRFWNKMDFAARPISNVKKIETKISFSERDGEYILHFEVTGEQGLHLTIEMCFDGLGVLSETTTDGKNYFLGDTMGVYRMGNDRIEFGPGVQEHSWTEGLEGERYSSHFGNLRTGGFHVYLTGTTPFNHQLVMR